MKWVTEGFDGFSRGTMENGGQNLYVSKKGTLQRIFQYDINGDGHPDLLFACSQSMYERPPIHIYPNLPADTRHVALPSGGTFDGLFCDLHHSGYEDLVLACQHNGTHTDLPAILYFGGPEGLTEQNRMELPAPASIGVCAGDFNGDGRMDLVFLSAGQLRVFYQEERGFAPSCFTDVPLNLAAAAAADLDGDGFCDLYFRAADGRVGVLFGGPEGLRTEPIVWLPCTAEASRTAGTGSTANVVEYDMGWKPAVLSLGKTSYLFAVEDGGFSLYTCDNNRTIRRVQWFACPQAVSAAAGDLTGNGFDDLAVAVFADRDETADCRIYLGGPEGLREDASLHIPFRGAAGVTIADLDGPALIVSRAGERIEQDVPCPVYRVSERGAVPILTLTGGDSTKILAGYPAGGDQPQVVMLNHKMNRREGGENIYIYLGGSDGYLPERRLELPAHSAVDGVMCDFFDTGNVDVLVCNCFEDAPYRDDGSYLYRNDGTGVDPNRFVRIPTVRSHGVALGDFRKSGYLDLAFGGFNNRELRIFHGSENGYSLDNCTRIVLGPDDGYVPEAIGRDVDISRFQTEEERQLIEEYGQVRWVLAADFNCDGWLDLFVSEICGPRSFIFWGGPEGFSKERMTALLTDGVASASVADLNGNGWPDLILAQHQSIGKKSFYESYVTVYWGGPDGYQENRKMQLPVSCANSVTVGDYSGSGSLDIYATAYNNGRSRDLLSYLYPGDNGSYSVENVRYLFNHSGSGCVSGDFNGDGYTDLAVACHKKYGNHMSESFIFWGGPGGLSEERKTVLPTVGPHGMSTVDPGNILDRGDRERYVSEAYRLPTGARVTSLIWDGECTSTSWVETELRAAETEDGLSEAPWQSVRVGEDLSALGLSGVIQYRLSLCAKCSCGTPRIRRVTVHYESTSQE